MNDRVSLGLWVAAVNRALAIPVPLGEPHEPPPAPEVEWEIEDVGVVVDGVLLISTVTEERGVGDCKNVVVSTVIIFVSVVVVETDTSDVFVVVLVIIVTGGVVVVVVVESPPTLTIEYVTCLGIKTLSLLLTASPG